MTINWEEEYFKKADYANSLEQKLQQAERRLDAWERVRAGTEPIRYDPIGPLAEAAVRQTRVQDMQYNLSVCDEQIALMANNLETVCDQGIDALVREFKKTITYDVKYDGVARVTVARLSAIMERK